MARYKIALSLGLALVLVAACERPSAVAEKDDRPAARSESAERASDAPREIEAARREEPAREIDGKPIWASSRRGTAEENAQRAFDRNGEAFGARDLDDFVRKAHAFVEKPPAGAERLTRANGDQLFYDPKGNVFAVATKDGTPRTMFKPDDGAAYWQQQKDRIARRQTAGAERDSGDS